MDAPPREGALPAVELDPEVEITPFALFRRLREGESPLLVDVRPRASGLTFRGAVSGSGPGWRPPGGRPAVLFDDDGESARELARRLRADGHEVASLFGGLRLYDFALDPEVVGEERYLSAAGCGGTDSRETTPPGGGRRPPGE